jgi:uncharacterized membrane protein YadS
MSDEQIPLDNSWKTKTLLVGAVLGLLTGLGAAYLLTKRAEETGQTVSFTPGKGLQLGVVLTGLMKSVQRLGE